MGRGGFAASPQDPDDDGSGCGDASQYPKRSSLQRGGGFSSSRTCDCHGFVEVHGDRFAVGDGDGEPGVALAVRAGRGGGFPGNGQFTTKGDADILWLFFVLAVVRIGERDEQVVRVVLDHHEARLGDGFQREIGGGARHLDRR